MKATPALHEKFTHRGGTVELVVWQVPTPVPPTLHGFKYRLVYVVDGVRVVGYDNERGKGDHKHLGERDQPCAFIDVARLMADFWADVEVAR